MKRILIVESNVDQCLALSDFLGDLGFETGVADTGRRAMKMLETAEVLPDFILLDVKLSSVNNWRLKDQLKRHKAYKHIPIILMGEDAVGEEVELDVDFKIPYIIRGLFERS